MYYWVHMPMDIGPAPEVFQCKLNQAQQGLPGIKIASDDILIIREDVKKEATQDHDTKL